MRSYEVTDSTVVINELLPADQRYARERTLLPIELPLHDVVSLERMKTNVVLTAGGVLWVVIVAGFIIWLKHADLAIWK